MQSRTTKSRSDPGMSFLDRRWFLTRLAALGGIILFVT